MGFEGQVGGGSFRVSVPLYPVSEFGRGGMTEEKEWGLGLESTTSLRSRKGMTALRKAGGDPMG